MSTKALQEVLDVLNDSAGISDVRMDRFLMKSPLQFITVILLYLAVVYKIGPKFMKNRKPYSLRNVMIVYNCIQIIANGAIFLAGVPHFLSLSIFCTPPERLDGGFNSYQIRLHYSYILLKFFDLIETVFYVLRKKDKQISFLHVYHHVGILVAAWISGKYFPGGQALYVGFYNTLIHCIMYCYYLITCLRPNSVAMWWKKYVTALQIVQHCIIFLSVSPVVFNVNCSYPKGWMGAFSLNVLLIIFLFARFYRDAYLRKNKLN
ncbi:very long chain fatty acid elongase AAEL008004-like [Zophobas morio]|uniref:very long chain fatty acid elongase AAEL008004-like n=1 Tax=Zophobas morio TaxID=2755281 RepID=UPI0030836A5B